MEFSDPANRRKAGWQQAGKMHGVNKARFGALKRLVTMEAGPKQARTKCAAEYTVNSVAADTVAGADARAAARPAAFCVESLAAPSGSSRDDTRNAYIGHRHEADAHKLLSYAADAHRSRALPRWAALGRAATFIT